MTFLSIETGCFNHMKYDTFKILTFISYFTFVIFKPQSVVAFENIIEKGNKNILRISVVDTKDNFLLNRKNGLFYLDFNNYEIYLKTLNDLKNSKYITKYFSPLDNSLISKFEKDLIIPLRIKKDLKIEFFYFYDEKVNKTYIDFWTYGKKKRKTLLAQKKKKTSLKKIKKIKNNNTISNSEMKKEFKSVEVYKDFRYGTPFIWNYDPVKPTLKKVININVKTADYFFSIKDVDHQKNDKLALVQVAINLYRKKKWGLMSNSIDLYSRKYGNDDNRDIFDFMLANSVQKSNLVKADLKLNKLAYRMYLNLSKKTQNLDLKLSLLRYLMYFSYENNSKLDTVKISTKLMHLSKKLFDYEILYESLEFMLRSLVDLRQFAKIKSLLKNELVNKILPEKKKNDYLIYTFLNENRHRQIEELYNKYLEKFSGKIGEGTLFNIGESLFRNAKYKKSIKIFDKYLSQYSYSRNADYARLRIALSYDILNENHFKIKSLYESTVNYTSLPGARIEAKIRLVGFEGIRKKNDESNIKLFSLLNLSKLERRYLVQKLKTLLWIARIRTLIVKKQYIEAYKYYRSLPLKSLERRIRNVFQEDGGEIAYGIIKKNYEKKKYSDVINWYNKLNKNFKKNLEYNRNIGLILSDSYLKLNILSNKEKIQKFIIQTTENKRNSYPRWVDDLDIKNIENHIKKVKLELADKTNNLKNFTKIINTIDLAGNSDDFYEYKIKSLFKNKKYSEVIKLIKSTILKDDFLSKLTGESKKQILSYYFKSYLLLNKNTEYKNLMNALKKDIFRNVKFRSLLEKFIYEEIEINLRKNNKDISLINSFIASFPKSVYRPRVEYLKILKSKDSTDSAKSNFNKSYSIIQDGDGIPSYIKKLSDVEKNSLVINHNDS